MCIELTDMVFVVGVSIMLPMRLFLKTYEKLAEQSKKHCVCKTLHLPPYCLILGLVGLL
jgi:hypothetical protein